MGNNDRPIQAAAGLAGSGHESVAPDKKSGDGTFLSGAGSAAWDDIAGTGYLLADAMKGPKKPGETSISTPQHTATAASGLTNLVLGFAGSTYTLLSNPSIVGKEIVNAGNTIASGSAEDRGRLAGHFGFFAATLALTGGGTTASSSLRAESTVARATARTSDALAGTIRATELNAGREGLVLGAGRETALAGAGRETLLTGAGRETTTLAARVDGLGAAAENMGLRSTTSTVTADAGWGSRVLPQMTGAATDNLSFLSRVSENGLSADALAGTVRIGETTTERSALATRLARLTGNATETPLAATVQDLQQVAPRLRNWQNVGTTITDAGETGLTGLRDSRSVLRSGLGTGTEGTGLLATEQTGALNTFVQTERTAVTTPSALFENAGRVSIESSQTTAVAARQSIQDFGTNLSKLLENASAQDRPILERLARGAEGLTVDNPTALTRMEESLSSLSPAASRDVEQLLRNVDGSIAAARQAQEVVTLGNAAGHSVESFATRASQLAEETANTPFKSQLQEIANGAKQLVPGADNAEALASLRTKVMGLGDQGLQTELLASFDTMTPSLTRAMETGTGAAGRFETLAFNAAERSAVTAPSALFENAGRVSLETSQTTAVAARQSIQDFGTNLGKLLEKASAEDRPILETLARSAEGLTVDNPTALTRMEESLSSLSPTARRDVEQLLRNVDGSIATARQAQEVVTLGNAAGHSVESFATRASQLAEETANTPFKSQLQEIANGAKQLVPGADNAEALASLRTKVMGLSDQGLKTELLAGFDNMTPALTRVQTAQELAATASVVARDVETFSTTASRLATTVAEDGTGVRTQLQNIADGAKNLVPGADNSEVLASLRRSAQALKNEGVQREVLASLDQLEPALARTQNLQELSVVARTAGRELDSFTTTATRLAADAGAETPAARALNEIAQGARRIVPGADNSEVLNAMRVAARDIEPGVQRQVLTALDRLEPTLTRAQTVQDLVASSRVAVAESESFAAATTRLASTEAAAPFAKEFETIANNARRIVPGADNAEALNAMRAAARDITEPAVQRQVVASLDRLEPALGRAQAMQDVVTSSRVAAREMENFSAATARLAASEGAAPYATQFETLANNAKRIVPGADNAEALAAMRTAAADMGDTAVARQVAGNIDRMEASLVRAQRVEDAVRLGQAARTEEALATIRATETAGARLTETLNTVVPQTERETAALQGISRTANTLQYGADNAAAFKNIRQAIVDLPAESRVPIERAVTNLERTYGYAQRMEPMTVAARTLEQSTALASDTAAALSRTTTGAGSPELAAFRRALAEVTPAADNTAALEAARNNLARLPDELRVPLVKPLQSLQDAATIARAETFEFYGPRVSQNVQAIQAGDISAARIAETQQAIAAMRAMAPAGTQTATSLGQLSQAIDGVQAANNMRSSLGGLLTESLTLTGWRTGKQLDLVKDALTRGDLDAANRWADRLVLTGRDLSRVSDGPVKDLLTARQQFWQAQDAVYAAQRAERAANMLPGVVEGLSPAAREAANRNLAMRIGAYGMYGGAGMLLPFDAYVGYRGIMNMANDYRVSQGQAPLPVYGQDSLAAARGGDNNASASRNTTNAGDRSSSASTFAANAASSNSNQVMTTARGAVDANATARDAQTAAGTQSTTVGGDLRSTAGGGGTNDSTANYVQLQNNQGALVTQATFGRNEAPNPVMVVTSGFSNNPNGAGASWLRLQHANGVYYGPGVSLYDVADETTRPVIPYQPIRRFSTAETTTITPARPSMPAFDPIRVRNLFEQNEILASTRGPNSSSQRPGLNTTGGTQALGASSYGPSSWDWKQGVIRASLVDNDKAHHLAQLEQTIEHRDGPGGSGASGNTDPQGGLTVASLSGTPDPANNDPTVTTVAQDDEELLRVQLTAGARKPGQDETLVTQA